MHHITQVPTPVTSPVRFVHSNAHHLEVAGVQVEIRYKPSAPTLQEKMIMLCNQSLKG